LHPDDFLKAAKALLRERARLLPAHIQAVFIQNALKLFARASSLEAAGKVNNCPI